MSTITLPNIRVSSDLTVSVRLKDNGVAIDWSTLNNVKASIYSDAQRALAGRCDVSVDAEDPTVLVCQYAANKPQYVGVCRIVVSARYRGETKTYDKPAFNFVRWTADQDGEQITIDDPDVDVEIEVSDVSSSLLDEAIRAAFAAAEEAVDAKGQVLETEAEVEAAEALRVSAEESRVESEEGRVEAEAARVDEEAVRVSAEDARVVAENARAAAENLREGAEDDRAAAETARETAEAARVAAEALRVSAESSRETAEAARVSQASADHTVAAGDHTQAAADHTQASADHTTAASDHTQAGADHTLAAADHVTAGEDHAQAQDDHEVMAGYDTRLGNVEGEVSQLEAKVDEKLSTKDIVRFVETTWANGYINESGGVNSSQYSEHSEFVEIESGFSYNINTSSSSAWYIAYYDSADENGFLSSQRLPQSPVDYLVTEFIIPQGATHFRATRPATTNIKINKVKNGEQLPGRIPEYLDEINDNTNKIRFEIGVQTRDGQDIVPDLDVADKNGKVLARFAGGHIKTKKFDSAEFEQMSSDFNSFERRLDIVEGKVVLLENGGYEISEEFVRAEIDNYLDSHPEATTTVQDGSITDAKLSNAVKGRINIIVANAEELENAINLGYRAIIVSGEITISSPIVVHTIGQMINTVIFGGVFNLSSSMFVCGEDVTSYYLPKFIGTKFIGNGNNISATGLYLVYGRFSNCYFVDCGLVSNAVFVQTCSFADCSFAMGINHPFITLDSGIDLTFVRCGWEFANKARCVESTTTVLSRYKLGVHLSFRDCVIESQQTEFIYTKGGTILFDNIYMEENKELVKTGVAPDSSQRVDVHIKDSILESKNGDYVLYIGGEYDGCIAVDFSELLLSKFINRNTFSIFRTEFTKMVNSSIL